MSLFFLCIGADVTLKFCCYDLSIKNYIDSLFFFFFCLDREGQLFFFSNALRLTVTICAGVREWWWSFLMNTSTAMPATFKPSLRSACAQVKLSFICFIHGFPLCFFFVRERN